jgi:2-polyprenyl-3-methyl-5-hydroxy-6-metoxy-1,4-benzoquinol methylase
MDANTVEQFITQTPIIAGCLMRIAQAWPRPLPVNELFGSGGIAAIANQALLQCMLKTIGNCSPLLEFFLTQIRFFLLTLTQRYGPDFPTIDDRELGLYCALAQQCFINEYVFAQSDDETRHATALRDVLSEKLAAGGEIAPLLLIAVAAYFSLHTLAMAESLLQRAWTDTLDDLLRQQIREPFEEMKDCATIPALTTIEDQVSLQVRQQYEENPYPRWTVMPPAKTAGSGSGKLDVLVAGCGTGMHSCITALLYPQARILAIDISTASLAYARRKSREAGLTNIDYAQADILKLSAIARTFDRIEVIGVLHHLANPKAGWRVLLSLLRPGGTIHVGLYSEVARRAVVAGRALIAQRGYPATAEGIRACRQEIFRCRDGALEKSLTTMRDFYGTSGCRDLLFNVMEHRFTLPEIKALLADHDLSFLGFDVEPDVLAAFQRQFPDPAALGDFDRWHSFETGNPETFLGMYQFMVRKNR